MRMSRTRTILGHGLGIWAFPFLVGMGLFPLQAGQPALFDTLMSLALVVGVLFFATRCLRRGGGASTGAMVRIGLGWAGLCLAIDLPLFLLAFDWTLADYVADVGLGYLLIPLVSGGLARAFALGARGAGRSS